MSTRVAASSILSVAAVATVLAVPVAGAPAKPWCVLVSATPTGGPSNDRSGRCGVTSNGRYVVFQSEASDLVPGDTNATADIFVRDTRKGTLERVSVGWDGAQSSGQSLDASISDDGRWIVFTSFGDLAPVAATSRPQVFLRDRRRGTTTLVSVAPDGAPANGLTFSEGWSISADGRWVAFESFATNLVPGDTNGIGDAFVRDLRRRVTRRVSAGASDDPPAGNASGASISPDGRFVAFSADSLGGWSNVYVADVRRGTVTRVTYGAMGQEPDQRSFHAVVSGKGRRVAFASDAENLVLDDTNHVRDVFVWTRATRTIRRESVRSGGAQASGFSDRPAITDDGKRLAYFSFSSDLVSGDANGFHDVFLRDTRRETTSLVSVTADGAPCDGPSETWLGCLSRTGRWLTIASGATNLVETGGPAAAVNAYLLDLKAR